MKTGRWQCTRKLCVHTCVWETVHEKELVHKSQVSSPKKDLGQGLAHFFCKGPVAHTLYFRFCRLKSLCCNHPATVAQTLNLYFFRQQLKTTIPTAHKPITIQNQVVERDELMLKSQKILAQFTWCPKSAPQPSQMKTRVTSLKYITEVWNLHKKDIVSILLLVVLIKFPLDSV